MVRGLDLERSKMDKVELSVNLEMPQRTHLQIALYSPRTFLPAYGFEYFRPPWRCASQSRCVIMSVIVNIYLRYLWSQIGASKQHLLWSNEFSISPNRKVRFGLAMRSRSVGSAESRVAFILKICVAWSIEASYSNLVAECTHTSMPPLPNITVSPLPVNGWSVG
jgi:hypothetical protein